MAFDLCGIKFRKVGKNFLHQCPFCGHDAKAVKYYGRCPSVKCPVVCYDGEMVLRNKFGTKASEIPLVIRNGGFESNSEEDTLFRNWIAISRKPFSMAAEEANRRLQQRELDMSGWDRSSHMIERKDLEHLLESSPPIEYDAQDINHLPDFSLGYIVQSLPWRIDKLFVGSGNTAREFVWRAPTIGFIGLTELDTCDDFYLCSSPAAAIKFRKNKECRKPVVALHDIPKRTIDWYSNDTKKIAVIENHNDLVNLQRLADFTETDIHAVRSPRYSDVHTLEEVRRKELLAMVIATNCSPEVERLYELTGAKTGDIDYLTRNLLYHGLEKLAKEVRKMRSNRRIYQDKDVEVREVGSVYTQSSRGESSEISNFTINVKRNIAFASTSEIVHELQISCADYNWKSLVSETSLGSAEDLQSELRVSAGALSDRTPTIFDNNFFRKFVLPFLRRQSAETGITKGSDRLGWSPDKSQFYLPGRTLTADSDTVSDFYVNPKIQTLRLMRADIDWSSGVVDALSPDAYRILCALVVPVARYYFGSPVRPVCILQDSYSTGLLKKLFNYVGQSAPFEMSHNIRDAQATAGFYGYPLLVSGFGYAKVEHLHIPYVIMANKGLNVGRLSDDEADLLGRCFASSIVDVANWCLGGGEGYEEFRSIEADTSLVHEGDLIIRRAMDLKNEPVAIPAHPLDDFLKSVNLDLISRNSSGGVDIKKIPSDEQLVEFLKAGFAPAINDGCVTLNESFADVVLSFYGCEL